MRILEGISLGFRLVLSGMFMGFSGIWMHLVEFMDWIAWTLVWVNGNLMEFDGSW